jgi:hypothetical protein
MNDAESRKTREHYWKAQIDAWQASGQSQRAFCKAHDLDYPRFGYWLRKCRRQGQVAQPRRASGFIPVVAASAGDGLSVHLPNGIELRGVSEQNLHVVEHLLARL